MKNFLTDFWDFTMQEHYNVLRITQWYRGKFETAEIARVYPVQHVYSLAKVLTMTAVGMLVDRGKLSIEDSVLPHLLRQDNLCVNDSRWEQMRVKDLLGHRAGFPEGFLDVDQQNRQNFGTGDFLAYALQTPLLYAPGKERTYSDGAYYLLGRIVENVSGMSLHQYLMEKLLEPLNIRDVAWKTCPEGHALGATGLYLRTEDLCKIGLLYHLEGMYAGRQLLSREWVWLAREREWELARVHTNGTYGKGGMMGQMLLIIPSEDRIVTWQAYDQKRNDRLIRFAAGYGKEH